VPIRAPLPRVLMWVVVLVCGAVAVTGGLALRGPEIVAVGVAAGLAGCMAAGIARESAASSRTRSTLETAASVGAATVVVLLILAGIAALAGGAVAALSVVAVLVVGLVARMARGRGPAAQSTADRAAAPRHPSIARAPLPQAAELASLLPPVTVLTTAELGQEWTRTTAVLAGPLDAAARAALVARREEALDELERRDPAGFARWLAAGLTLASDPAGYVQGRPLRGDPAADTDAA
jgi:hypothetical protein